MKLRTRIFIARRKQGNFTKLQFNYPSSVSGLVASLGGNIYVLNYPPNISARTSEISDSAYNHLKTGRSLLNNQLVASAQFAEILDGILSVLFELALKQRKQKRLMCLKQLRSVLCEWLQQLTEYRYEIQNNFAAANDLDPQKLCSSSFNESQRISRVILQNCNLIIQVQSVVL